MRTIWTPSTEETDEHVVGAKAYRLIRMLHAGFNVPDFYVIGMDSDESGTLLDPATWASAIHAHETVLADHGTRPVIVRSSSLSEDWPCAFSAGQYLTIPDVRSASGLLRAINTVILSQALGSTTAQSWTRGMAVIVQRQIQGDWFGVASVRRSSLSAPVAVEMASSRSDVTDGRHTDYTCTVNSDGSVTVPIEDIGPSTSTLRQLASDVRAIAVLFTQPIDVEFAISGAEIFLLQAKPTARIRRTWHRTTGRALPVRLGVEEWLTRRISTLFADIILPHWESSAAEQLGRALRIDRPIPSWITIEGIYYYRLDLRSALQVFRAALTGFNNCHEVVTTTPSFFDSFFKSAPDYSVTDKNAHLDPQSANLARFLQAVDWTAFAYARLIISGLACRLMDARIRTHYRLTRTVRWRLPRIDDLVVEELARSRIAADIAAGVDSVLDSTEYRQLDLDPALAPLSERDLAALRRLNSMPKSANVGFSSVSSATPAKAMQPRSPAARKWLTRVWPAYAEQLAVRDYRPLQFQRIYPLLREAISRIQKDVCEQSGELAPDDIFHLTLRELLELNADAYTGDILAVVQARKAIWSDPGPSPAPAVAMLASQKLKFRSVLLAGSRARRLTGRPASPGRASGHAVIHYDIPDLQRHRPGTILVAPRTTPAWTPLLRTSAAVVTETGNVLSHTSITARALGIPAIVDVKEAMTHIADGDWIVVDGSKGILKIVRSSQ